MEFIVCAPDAAKMEEMKKTAKRKMSGRERVVGDAI